MNSIEESLATWSMFIGTLISLFGLIQSQAWLAVVGGLFAGTSVMALLYARRERLVVESARVRIEGRSLDCLNAANLGRRVNRALVVQAVNHVARIEGESVRIEWEYSGYCRAAQETAMEFSVDSDTSIPFDSLDCFGHDLQRDPAMKHKIRPILVGVDGLSKKVAIPFLAPIAARESFRILLKCCLPGCMKPGLDYYTSTLSFDQDRIQRLAVRLVFVGRHPEWLRLYQCGPKGSIQLLKELPPARESRGITEYLDVAENVDARSARVFVFSRPVASARRPVQAL